MLPLTLAACAVVAVAPSAAAQPEPAPRGFVAVNGGLQTGSPDLSYSGRLEHALFGPEVGEVDTRQAGAGGAILDVGGGVRIWRSLAVGGGVSLFSHEGDAAVTAQLPHPFFFDRPRSVSGTATGLSRRETAVHLQALWMMPVGRSVDVALFGGPTFFMVAQDLVVAVGFDQSYPYDEATYIGAHSERPTGSTVGFHAGADVAVYFSARFGVGGTVRFSRGAVDLDPPHGGAVRVDVGGLHTTGGLRIRF